MKIYAIVGRSGSGKSLIANYISKRYGIKQLQSYTTREPRYENEKGHKFISMKEFKSFKLNDLIAYTEYGGDMYCCLKEDVTEDCIYVIDEFGLKQLEKSDHTIVSIYVHANKWQIFWRTDRIRRKRDSGKFHMSKDEFDIVIYSKRNKSDTLKQLANLDLF